MNYLFSIYLVQGDRLPCLIRRIRVGFSYYDPNSISERSPNNSPLGSYFLEGLSRPGLVNVSVPRWHSNKDLLGQRFPWSGWWWERDRCYTIKIWRIASHAIYRWDLQRFQKILQCEWFVCTMLQIHRTPLGEHIGTNNPMLSVERVNLQHMATMQSDNEHSLLTSCVLLMVT